MAINPNDPLVKNLIDFGLSEKEAKIYLALLELEIAPVQEVAKIAGINRSSAYVVLESLKKKGLASTSNEKKIQEYVATAPEALLQTADHLVKKQELIKGGISNIVPDLKAIYKGTKRKPKVRVFEGKQGLINALSETLVSKEKLIRFSSSAENLLKTIPEYLAEYGQRRYQLGFRLKFLLIDGKAADAITSLLPKGYDAVYIPKDKYPFPADLAIFDDKIGYMSIEKGTITTIIIEEKNIAKVMRGLFDLAWEEAGRISKKGIENRP